MTLHERLLLLRAINSRNIPNANDRTPAASAAVDARAIELYKMIDDLRHRIGAAGGRERTRPTDPPYLPWARPGCSAYLYTQRRSPALTGGSSLFS
jgi:hypothetical protein